MRAHLLWAAASMLATERLATEIAPLCFGGAPDVQAHTLGVTPVLATEVDSLACVRFGGAPDGRADLHFFLGATPVLGTVESLVRGVAFAPDGRADPHFRRQVKLTPGVDCTRNLDVRRLLLHLHILWVSCCVGCWCDVLGGRHGCLDGIADLVRKEWRS
jgi:hypothetical protein